MFDLPRLRLLLELSRRGTMTAVADALGFTSSAVSQQLATLERETGAVLFERVGRRVRLTPDGERLVAHAVTIFDAVDAATVDLRAARASPHGTLVVGSFPSFAKAYLVPAIVALRERAPYVRVVLRELEPVDAIVAVREGHCDVAVSFAYDLVPQPDIDDLVARPLVEEPVRLALPPRLRRERAPVDLARLAHEDWIVGSRQGDDRVLAERACAAAGFAPRMTHTVDDYDLQLRMIAAGLGVGFVPALGFAFSGAEGVVARAVRGLAPVRRIRALTRRALAASPRVLALFAAIDAG